MAPDASSAPQGKLSDWAGLTIPHVIHFDIVNKKIASIRGNPFLMMLDYSTLNRVLGGRVT